MSGREKKTLKKMKMSYLQTCCAIQHNLFKCQSHKAGPALFYAGFAMTLSAGIKQFL